MKRLLTSFLAHCEAVYKRARVHPIILRELRMTEEAARNGPQNDCQGNILFIELETRHTSAAQFTVSRSLAIAKARARLGRKVQKIAIEEVAQVLDQ
jgi:hypothetical protein